MFPQNQIIFPCLILCGLWLLQARPVQAAAAWNEVHRSQPLSSTSTTMEPPIIEDSLNSATSESSSSDQDDAICFKCYDQVEMTKTLIGIQLDLVKKQNDLIRKLQKNSTPKPDTLSTRRPKQPRQVPRPSQQDQVANENRTSSTHHLDSHQLSTRAWANVDADKPHVVVSTLRLVRSTDHLYPTVNASERKNRIPALKQWENKRKQQLNETCKALNELQSCLNGISKECLGDFHYHTYEMFSNQWYGRLHCYNLNLKPYGNLIRSVLPTEEQKHPIARPIPTPEETQAKLDAIFGRVGVMLKPTLTRPAAQKFNAMGQQEQQLDKGVLYQDGQFKGRYYSETSELRKGFSKTQSAGFMTSQLLLVPGFLVLCLALIAITMGRYLKREPPKA